MIASPFRHGFGLSCDKWMSQSLLVQRLGGQVLAIWPRKCAGFPIDPNLGEVSTIREWLQHTRPTLGREVNVPDGPVVEQQTQHLVAQHCYPHDDWKEAGSRLPCYGRGAIGRIWSTLTGELPYRRVESRFRHPKRGA
jgi:hypothetical protein